LVAPDEGLEAGGEVGEVGGRGRAQRGELCLQAFAGELVQGHGVIDVFEAVFAQGAQGDALQAFGQQMRDGVGDEDLRAVGGSADAGRDVDVTSYVALLGDLRSAGVNAHADAQLASLGPGMLGESALGLDCGLEGSLGCGEGIEEGVSLGVDLDPAVGGERFSQQGAVPALGRRGSGSRVCGGDGWSPRCR
jgi:hypothetical protein